MGKYASRCRRSTTARASGASMTPSTVCPRRSAARYAKTLIERPAARCRSCSRLLRDAEDLLHRGETGPRPGPGVLPQRGHAPGHRVAPESVGGRLSGDQAARRLGHAEQLVDADPAAVTGAPALAAARAVEQIHAGRVGHAQSQQPRRVGTIGRAARPADPPDQALVWSVERTRCPVSAAWMA